MSNITRQQIKAKIDQWVITNGQKLITGAQVNEILNDAMDSLVHFNDDNSYLNLREYSASRSYRDKECMVYNGLVYQNINGSTLVNVAPGALDPDPWFALTEIDSTLFQFEPYDNATSYVSPNTVRFGNKLYLCTNPTQGNPPPDGSYWQEISPSTNKFGSIWLPNTYYSQWQVVRYLDGLWQLNVNPGLLSTDIAAELATGDWSPIPNIISLSLSDLHDAITNYQIATGRIYYINDFNIYCIGLTQFSVSGAGWYLAINADFQGGGDYQGLVRKGIFNSLSTYDEDDVVIYDCLHWRNKNGNNPGPPPPGELGEWELLPLTHTSYIIEIDQIIFDIDTGVILERRDKRGNVVRGSFEFITLNDPMSSFQWGNDLVEGNVLNDGVLFCKNNENVIQGCPISGESALFSEGNQGRIERVEISNKSDATIAASPSKVYSNIRVRNGKSVAFVNFSTELSDIIMDIGFSNLELTASAASTIDFSAGLDFAGIYTILTGSSGSVSRFDNYPFNHNWIVKPESGLTLTIVHGTGFHQPRLKGGTNVVLNGSNGDWIEFRTFGGVIYECNKGQY